jgi:hypothetical protein
MKSLDEMNEGLFSKKKPKEVEKVITKMSDEYSTRLTELGKEEFKLTKKLLPLLKESLELHKQQRDLFQDSLDNDGPDTDHTFYRDTLDKEIAKYEDIIFGIEKGIW